MRIGCSKVCWPGDQGQCCIPDLRAAQPIAMSTPGYKATARRFARREHAEGRLDE